MRSLAGILLLTLYLVALLKPVAPLIEYAVNKDYIAKVLCINKDKPKMHCNGKCYLNKQLKKANDEEKEKPLPVRIKWNDYPIGFVEILAFKFSSSYIKNQVSIYLSAFLPSGFSTEIFHPPKD